MFEPDYCFSFIKPKTEDFGPNFKGSVILLETGSAARKWHIEVAKNILRGFGAQYFVQDEVPNVVESTYLDDTLLPTSKNVWPVLLLRAAWHYLTNPARPRGDFFVHILYKSVAQHVGALRAIFSKAHNHRKSFFASSGHDAL